MHMTISCSCVIPKLDKTSSRSTTSGLISMYTSFLGSFLFPVIERFLTNLADVCTLGLALTLSRHPRYAHSIQQFFSISYNVFCQICSSLRICDCFLTP